MQLWWPSACLAGTQPWGGSPAASEIRCDGGGAAVPAFRRQRQEEQKFKAIPGYIQSLSLI